MYLTSIAATAVAAKSEGSGAAMHSLAASRGLPLAKEMRRLAAKAGMVVTGRLPI
jgi:hypothetical protein